MNTVDLAGRGNQARAHGRALLKPFVIVVICMGALLGAIFGFQAFKGKMIGKFMAQSAAAPQTVATVAVKPSDWQTHLQASGTLRAVRVRARTSPRRPPASLMK